MKEGRSGLDEMVLCTWPDCIEAVKDTLPPQQQAQIKKIVLAGATVFQSMAALGYHVVTINPCGPGPGMRMKFSDDRGPDQVLNAWPAARVG
jgi:hypothetical protein